MHNLPKLGAAMALALALANANASPAFLINPNSNGGVLTNGGQTFRATAINGISSHRITYFRQSLARCRRRRHLRLERLRDL